VIIASARALRQPVCQREPTDLSTQAAGEAKLRIFLINAICAWPGSGFWHSSTTWLRRLVARLGYDNLTTSTGFPRTLTTGLMTNALTSRPTGDDSVAHAHLCAAAEPAASEPILRPTDPDSDSWRVEVAARLERYRTRRKPRTPRYPSLLLPFDAPESWSRPATASGGAAAGATTPAEQDFTFPNNEEPTAAEVPGFGEPHQPSKRYPSQQAPHAYPEQAPELSANVIEFPRSAAIPVFHPSDLADPVLDRHRPRIVEAPEILPPPPALGGMLIDPAHKEPVDRRAVDSPASSASIARRALAAFVDGIVLTVALAAFAAIFLRLNSGFIRLPNLSLTSISIDRPLPLLSGPALVGPALAATTLAGALGIIAVLLWASYKFLFVVYTGSTPGLRAARLRLAAFDGSPLTRRSRRWRVLASFLSAFSAGLGYLWCVLDQEGLCWHDRITRTHTQVV
jgi:uncharacterized RDD family membrane protein YckC